MSVASVYVANLGKYNEGELVGKRLDLPADEEEINNLFVKIGLGTLDKNGDYLHGLEVDGVCYEEFAIHDYETEIHGWEINEYDNLNELNELAEQIEGLESYEREHFEAYLEASGDSLSNALDSYEYSTFYCGMDLEEIAEEFLSECYDIPDNILNYIDYEKFARDLGYDGYTETANGVISM